MKRRAHIRGEVPFFGAFALPSAALFLHLTLGGPGIALSQSAPQSRPDADVQATDKQIRQLVLPGIARAMDLGLQIEVGETTPLPWRADYLKATDYYHDDVKLDARGGIHGYVAGLPFPDIDPNDPQAAHKIIWNQTFTPWVIDDGTARSVEWASGNLIEGRGLVPDTGADLKQYQESMLLRFYGRLRVQPTPEIPANRDHVLQMEALGPTFPSLQTLTPNGPLVTYRYLGAREDDVWYFIPFTRRLRRLAPSVRYNTPGQIVIDLNSIFGFDAPVASYSWRLLGRREMLGPVNVRNYPAKWCEGNGSFAPCDVWQKRNAWIVEATARLPYDAYSKRIIAIDDEAWLVLASDLYDGNAELWKTVFNFWRKRPVPDGRGVAEELILILAGSAVDLQARRALRWRFPFDAEEPIIRVNTGLEPIDFSVGRMSGAFR